MLFISSAPPHCYRRLAHHPGSTTLRFANCTNSRRLDLIFCKRFFCLGLDRNAYDSLSRLQPDSRCVDARHSRYSCRECHCFVQDWTSKARFTSFSASSPCSGSSCVCLTFAPLNIWQPRAIFHSGVLLRSEPVRVIASFCRVHTLGHFHSRRYLVSDFLNPFSTVAMSFFLLELLRFGPAFLNCNMMCGRVLMHWI